MAPVDPVPQGLSRTCLALLERHTRSVADSTLEELLARARLHLDEIRQAAASNRMLPVGLAEEICACIQCYGRSVVEEMLRTAAL